jgi:exodeoxyribonuclease VII large subunit
VKEVGGRKVWSVADVTAAIARRFDDVPPLWIEGEIQDLRQRAGQAYFALADEHRIAASMNSVVFDRLSPRPGDGERVHVYGRPQFWPPRGEFSIRVEIIQRMGEGALRAEIARLQEQLKAEGLLDAARKRPLPLLPRSIALVTSAAGAAREDFLRNVWQRFPRAHVVAVDVPVQGESAPRAISAALARVASTDVEVVVLTRGGGSLEDLMAFNSELVARAIADSPVPIVAAVGHERDTTIADLVADLRVSTPTAAAVAVVPDERELMDRLTRASRVLNESLSRLGRDGRAELERLEAASRRALLQHSDRGGARRDASAARLDAALRSASGAATSRVNMRRERLAASARRSVERAGARKDRVAAVLGAVSPAATVARGYAIVRDDSGVVVVTAASKEAGDALRLQLKDGELPVTVRER